jgi:hypothetical protein
MSERAPYSRVYWSVMEDPKFDGIREDPRLFGSWSLLLIAADMAHPSPAYLLPTVTRASVNRLAEAGLIDLLDGFRYRVHGLDAERERRRTAATTRGPSGDRPVPVRDPLGYQAEQSKAEAEQSTAEAPRDPADIYWSLTGRYPNTKTLGWIDDLTAKYGAEPTIAAIARAHIQEPNAGALLGRAQDILRARARELDRQERVAEQRALEEKRSQPRVEEAWRLEYRAAIERQYREGAA